FSSRRRHTRFSRDWSSDVYSSDLTYTNQIRTYMQTAEERFILAQDWETNLQRFVQHQLTENQKEELVEKINTSVEALATPSLLRSEERRVGKESKSRQSPQDRNAT